VVRWHNGVMSQTGLWSVGPINGRGRGLSLPGDHVCRLGPLGRYMLRRWHGWFHVKTIESHWALQMGNDWYGLPAWSTNLVFRTAQRVA